MVVRGIRSIDLCTPLVSLGKVHAVTVMSYFIKGVLFLSYEESHSLRPHEYFIGTRYMTLPNGIRSDELVDLGCCHNVAVEIQTMQIADKRSGILGMAGEDV